MTADRHGEPRHPHRPAAPRGGFTGAVVTDALDMAGIGGPAQIPTNVVRAVAAGDELCCLGPDTTAGLVDACTSALVGAVAHGALPEARLLDAAARVTALRFLPRDRWPGQPVPRQVSPLGAVGAEAARRALRIEVPPALSGAHVVELERPANVAAGTVPWGLAGPLAAADPTTTPSVWTSRPTPTPWPGPSPGPPSGRWWSWCVIRSADQRRRRCSRP